MINSKSIWNPIHESSHCFNVVRVYISVIIEAGSANHNSFATARCTPYPFAICHIGTLESCGFRHSISEFLSSSKSTTYLTVAIGATCHAGPVAHVARNHSVLGCFNLGIFAAQYIPKRACQVPIRRSTEEVNREDP